MQHGHARPVHVPRVEDEIRGSFVLCSELGRLARSVRVQFGIRHAHRRVVGADVLVAGVTKLVGGHRHTRVEANVAATL